MPTISSFPGGIQLPNIQRLTDSGTVTFAVINTNGEIRYWQGTVTNDGSVTVSPDLGVVPQDDSVQRILGLTLNGQVRWRNFWPNASSVPAAAITTDVGFIAYNSLGSIVRVFPYTSVATWTALQSFAGGISSPIVDAGTVKINNYLFFNGIEADQNMMRFLTLGLDYNVRAFTFQPRNGLRMTAGVLDIDYDPGLIITELNELAVDTSYAFAWLARHSFYAGIELPLLTSFIRFSSDIVLGRFPSPGKTWGNNSLTLVHNQIILAQGVTSSIYPLHIRRAGNAQIMIEYDATTSAQIEVNAGGNMVLRPKGNLILDTDVVRPSQNWWTDLGAPNAKFLRAFIAEAVFDNIVAQDVMSSIGGRILTAPTSVLIFAIPAIA